VRLHLLQGVVAFHMGQTFEAKRLIERASKEADELQINGDHLVTLMSMGYTLKECRRALRSCQGIDAAAQYVIQKRLEREEREEKERKRRAEEREQKKYGKTVSGQRVNMQHLKDLSVMGYNKDLIAESLKQSNNNLNDSLLMLLDPSQREILETAVQTFKAERLAASQRRFPSLPRVPRYQQEETQLVGMGFDVHHSRFALRLNRGNVTECITLLTQESTVIDALMAANPEILQDLEAEFPSSGSDKKIETPTSTTTTSTDKDGDTIINSDETSNRNESSDSTMTTTTTTTTADSSSSSSSSSSKSGLNDELDAKAIEEQFYRAERNRKLKEEEEKKRLEREKKLAEEREIDLAAQELLPDIGVKDDPDAYLDIDLDKEIEAIKEYSLLVASITTPVKRAFSSMESYQDD